MFFRRKLSGRTEYLQIVKNERVEGKARQSVVATLGRIDASSRRRSSVSWQVHQADLGALTVSAETPPPRP